MISIYNATKEYIVDKRSRVLAIAGISYDFPNKGVVSIVGESGSGKTTLLNLLSGLDVPSEGKVVAHLEECDFELSSARESEMDDFRNLYMGFVFQDCNLIEEWNVYDNIRIVLEQQYLNGVSEIEIKERVLLALSTVGLEEYGNRRINELSGGQRQRVAIARCIVKQSNVIFADEPTGNLDSENSERIMDLFRTIGAKCLVILVTHNVDAALRCSDQIIHLVDGRIASVELLHEEKIEFQNVVKSVSKSRNLPFNVLLRLAKDNLRVRKVRLIVFILLFFVLGFSLFVLCAVRFRSIELTITQYAEENDIQRWFPVITATVETPNGYHESITVARSEYLHSCLNEIFSQKEIVYSRKNPGILVEGKGDLFGTGFFLVEGMPKQMEGMLKGRVAMSENEIIVTDMFCEELRIDTDDALGKTIIIDGVPVHICGVMSYGYNRDSITTDKQLQNCLRLYVAEGFDQYVKAGTKAISLPYSSLSRWNFSLMVTDQNSIAPYDEKLNSQYIEGQIPTEINCILISEMYAFENDIRLVDPESLSFTDCVFTDLEKIDKELFTNAINLASFLSDVHVSGIIADSAVDYDIYVNPDIYKLIKDEYFEKCYYDSFEIVAADSIKKSQLENLFDFGIMLENNEVQSIQSVDEELKILDGVLTIAIILVAISLLFVMFLFFSCNIKDNEKKIGIMRALGVRKRSVAYSFLIASGIIGFGTAVVSWLFAAISVKIVNFEIYKRIVVTNNQICNEMFLFPLVFALVVLTSQMAVGIPLNVFFAKRPVELIQRK